MVVDIMCRGNLQTSGTELNVNVSIFDNRNDTVDQWYDNVQTLQPCVLYILWVDAHCRVTHDCLRTGGSNNSIITLLVLMHYVAFILTANLSLVVLGNIVFQIVKL